MLDLTADQLTEVRCILAKHVPDREVRAFGSRVTGMTKPFSDLDLAVIGDDPVDFRTLATLKDAFADSGLPFRVDVVDWARTDLSFQQIIKQNCLVIQASHAKKTPLIAERRSRKCMKRAT